MEKRQKTIFRSDYSSTMDEEVDSTIAITRVREYLSQVCPMMLGLKHGAEFVEEQLATPDSDFAIKKFVTRPDTMVMFVDHVRSGDDTASGMCEIVFCVFGMTFV